MQYTCCPWTVGHLPQLWSRQQQRGAGTVIGGLLLFALGALLTASYLRLRRRQAQPAIAVTAGASAENWRRSRICLWTLYSIKLLHVSHVPQGLHTA